MSEMDAVADLLGGGRTISYKTDLAHMTGSVTAGLLLSQFWYWTNILPPDREGWFYKTAEEMQSETGMGRTEAEGARKKLRDLGLVTEERRGVPAKLWYRINKVRLNELLGKYAANKIAENLQTGVQKTRKQDSLNSANKPAESQQTITQNTTQNAQKLHPQPITPQPMRTSEQESVVVFPAALEKALIAAGVTPKVAGKLLRTYPEAAVRQQLEWLPQRRCNDPAATLVEAIKENYGPPATARKPLPRPKPRASPPLIPAPPVASEGEAEKVRTALAEARRKVRSLR